MRIMWGGRGECKLMVREPQDWVGGKRGRRWRKIGGKGRGVGGGREGGEGGLETFQGGEGAPWMRLVNES